MSNMQPTYKRQRFLLAFLQQIAKGVSSTDLQKLVFLYSMNHGASFYEFIPYKFGAYSFQLAEDVEILNRGGYLVVGDRGVQAVNEAPKNTLFQISQDRGKSLLRKAYRQYPYYAIRSQLLKRLFSAEEMNLFTAERLKYEKNAQTLFTIGYEGRSIEAFINVLIQNGVKVLCDIRKNPLSRKIGFSKIKLKHITEAVGIKYLHIPELGIESRKRSTLETPEDYKALFAAYAETLPELLPWLKELYLLLSSNLRVALMCYEKEALMCHRHVVRDYLINSYAVSSRDL